MAYKFNPFTGKLEEYGPILTGTGTVAAAADGTAALPGISFANDLSVGIYRPGPEQLAISTNGTGRLFIDSSGRVGVGTTSPLTRQQTNINSAAEWTSGEQLVGTTNASSTAFYLLNEDSSITATETSLVLGAGGSAGAQHSIAVKRSGSNTGDLIFRRRNGSGGSLESLRIDSSGRLGIGTTNPGTIFQARIATNKNIGFDLSNGEPRISCFDDAVANAVPLVVNGSDCRFEISSNEKARITSSGQLLVGTSSTLPAYYNSGGNWNGVFQVARSSQDAVANFSIWNSIASTYTTYGGAQIHLSACKSGTVGSHTSGALANGDSIASINFNASDGTNFRNAARIEAVVDAASGTADVPGRLVFSTTADGSSSPTERMRINNAGNVTIFGQSNQLVLNRSGHSNWNFSNGSAGLLLSQDLQDGNGAKQRLLISQESSPAFGIQFFNTSEVETLRVEEDGDVLNTNNSYGALSDIKLKENIVDASSQWGDLKALQVRKYNFKTETGYNTHTQIGLIAQEVELVSPGLVSETPDHDEEGNDLGTVTKSVNYSVLYMKAVKALQEAMERIETLEAKVAALEAN